MISERTAMDACARSGYVLIDKPIGITSRDAVDQILRLFPRGTRLGHAGTLDPLASGLLILCVNSATRLTEFVHDLDKTYLAEICLGATSATDDAEGPIVPRTMQSWPEVESIEVGLKQFIGEIQQVPPNFSAAKVRGKRAYALARAGNDVQLAPKTVWVGSLRIHDYVPPLLRLEVLCGKGTYIRSLARDLGEHLGCGGYLTGLRRTRIGPFGVASAQGSPWPTSAEELIMHPLKASLVHLPHVVLDPPRQLRIRHGQAIPWPADWELVEHNQAPHAALLDEGGELIAVAVNDRAEQKLRPSKVMSA